MTLWTTMAPSDGGPRLLVEPGEGHAPAAGVALILADLDFPDVLRHPQTGEVFRVLGAGRDACPRGGHAAWVYDLEGGSRCARCPTCGEFLLAPPGFPWPPLPAP